MMMVRAVPRGRGREWISLAERKVESEAHKGNILRDTHTESKMERARERREIGKEWV